MMNQMRDNYSLGILEIRSLQLLFEMEKVVQEGTEIRASGHRRDDRTIAMALANKAYVDRIRARLIAEGMTYEQERAREKIQAAAPSATFVASIVGGFFRGKQGDRAEREVSAAWKDAGLVL